MDETRDIVYRYSHVHIQFTSIHVKLITLTEVSMHTLFLRDQDLNNRVISRPTVLSKVAAKNTCYKTQLYSDYYSLQSRLEPRLDQWPNGETEII